MWKENAQKAEVDEENERGIGPVSLQKWMLNGVLYNLKEMIIEDGVPEVQVDEFRDGVQKNYL